MTIPPTLYSFHTHAEADEILRTGKVRLKTAIELGEPLEYKFTDIAKDWIDRQVRRQMKADCLSFKAALRAHVPGAYPFMGLSESALKLLRSTLKSASTLEHRHKIIRGMVCRANQYKMPDPREQYFAYDDQLDRVGMLQLFEHIDDSRLWTKYGGPGMTAIRFRVGPDMFLSDTRHCLPVNYSDGVPAFREQPLATIQETVTTEFGPMVVKRLSAEDPTFLSAITTKDIVNGYEREWRYFQMQVGMAKVAVDRIEAIASRNR